MIRITKEKVYLDDVIISREFLENNLELKFEADFLCADENKSFKVRNSTQSALSKQEAKNIKYLIKNKDKIISDYQELLKEPELDLEQLKLQKLSEAENYRKFLQFQPITYNDAEFSSSEVARQNILISVLTLNTSAKKNWIDKNDTIYEFNAKNFKEIATIISDRDSKLYMIETEVRNVIQQSKITALKSLKIATLWSKTERSYRQSAE